MPALGTLIPQWYPNAVAPANFAQLASAYMARHRVNRTDLKRAIAHVSVKSHDNGALNPKAHLRKRITEDQVLNAPIVAEPLGLFDRSEEHTSELQSLMRISYAVFCLKKKKTR